MSQDRASLPHDGYADPRSPLLPKADMQLDVNRAALVVIDRNRYELPRPG